MARHARTRYGIFVHDPDGDSGYGRIVGAYLDPDRAEDKADVIRRRATAMGRDIECIILPMVGDATAASTICDHVLGA
jgi:hypothetical protein